MAHDLRWSGVGLALLLAITTGCSSQKVMDENQRLRSQNVELQNELTRARSALDAAENDRAQMSGEVARLQAQLASRPTPVAAPPPPAPAPAFAANSGFDAIPGVETITDNDRITVRVPGDVLFAPGKVDLKTSARSTLQRIAQVIQAEYPSNTIRVEGYTDTDPIRRSKWKDNLELSLHRSAAVHRYLQSQGVPSERMYAAGFGENKPRATKSKSRRVEIVVELNS